MSKTLATPTAVDTTTGEILTGAAAAQMRTFLASENLDLGTLADVLDTPPAVFLNETEGAMLAFRFLSVAMAESEYGPAPVITFRAEAGYLVASTGGPVDIVEGEKYTMHLFSSVLNDLFIDLAPEVGELVILRYSGARTSRKRLDSNGEPQNYHLFTAVCPNRPVIERAALGWGDVKRKTAKR